jgi:hypothetical protein
MTREQRDMTDGDILRAFLATHDANCPQCAYQLRGVESEKCPECGRTIELQVQPAAPRMAPWLFALIFTSIFGGFHWIMLIAFGVSGLLYYGSLSVILSDSVLYLIGSIPYAITLPLLIARRRAFQRRTIRRQWVWSALLVFAYVVLETIWISLMFFLF